MMIYIMNLFQQLKLILARLESWKEKAFSIKSKSDKIVEMIQRLKFNLVMLAEDK